MRIPGLASSSHHIGVSTHPTLRAPGSRATTPKPAILHALAARPTCFSREFMKGAVEAHASAHDMGSSSEEAVNAGDRSEHACAPCGHAPGAPWLQDTSTTTSSKEATVVEGAAGQPQLQRQDEDQHQQHQQQQQKKKRKQGYPQQEMQAHQSLLATPEGEDEPKPSFDLEQLRAAVQPVPLPHQMGSRVEHFYLPCACGPADEVVAAHLGIPLVGKPWRAVSSSFVWIDFHLPGMCGLCGCVD